LARSNKARSEAAHHVIQEAALQIVEATMKAFLIEFLSKTFLALFMAFLYGFVESLVKSAAEALNERKREPHQHSPEK
jgi:hypothetical protein